MPETIADPINMTNQEESKKSLNIPKSGLINVASAKRVVAPQSVNTAEKATTTDPLKEETEKAPLSDTATNPQLEETPEVTESGKKTTPDATEAVTETTPEVTETVATESNEETAEDKKPEAEQKTSEDIEEDLNSKETLVDIDLQDKKKTIKPKNNRKSINKGKTNKLKNTMTAEDFEAAGGDIPKRGGRRKLTKAEKEKIEAMVKEDSLKMKKMMALGVGAVFVICAIIVAIMRAM